MQISNSQFLMKMKISTISFQIVEISAISRKIRRSGAMKLEYNRIFDSHQRLRFGIFLENSAETSLHLEFENEMENMWRKACFNSGEVFTFL